MNIKQLQRDAQAASLTMKFKPITDFILTGDIGTPATEDQRRTFIIQTACTIMPPIQSLSEFFASDVINGTSNIGEGAMGLDMSEIGRSLLKKYSANDIVTACTLYKAQIPIGLKIVLGDNTNVFLPAPKKEMKQSKLMPWAISSRGIDATGHEVIGYEDELVQEVRSANESGTKEVKYLSGSILELEKTIKSEPDFELPTWVGQTEGREKISVPAVLRATPESTKENILEIPDYNSAIHSRTDEGIYRISTPLVFEHEGRTLTLPSVVSDFMNRKFSAGRKSLRVFERDGFVVLDASTINTQEMYINEAVGVQKIQNIIQMDCLIVGKFTEYPSIYQVYNTADYFAEPPSREEIMEKNLEALTLPPSVTLNQMKVSYGGQRLPMSVASLRKWSDGNQTYAEAVEIMAQHLEYYTTFKDGVRQNNGAVYEATKAKFKALTEKRAKSGKKSDIALANNMFQEYMSKYVFSVEETFFNLNPDFADPEKLFGYFLGMGVLPNGLYTGKVNPYRILCARLLGVDYALNYRELCKVSTIKGYLYVRDFEKDGKPIYATADTMLQGNIYELQEMLESEKFGTLATKNFGEDNMEAVLESHMKLLNDHMPERMVFRHAEQEEYDHLVLKHGIGNAYIQNREEEITRITYNAGLVPNRDSRNTIYNEEEYSRFGNSPVVREAFLDLPTGFSGKNKARLFEAQAQKMLDTDDTINASTFFFGEDGYRSESAANLEAPFLDYARKTGKQLYGRASELLRFNDLDKRKSLLNFYFSPKSANEGTIVLLKEGGVRVQNGELDEGKPENKQSKLIKLQVVGKTRALRKKDKKKNQFVYPLVEKALTDAKDPNNKAARMALEELGYDLSDKKVLQGISRLITERALGSYYELSSQARVEGDELLTYGIASTLEPFILTLNEIYFNYKYNNFANKPLTHVPIFLENMRHFGNIGSRFTAESTLDNGKPAGFSLREAQRQGLKFLAASGNSGLLAHEVGFGKTTSSIAKISDMFLRGDAQRVLISVPKAVYDTKNWVAEIQGEKRNGQRVANGLLPSTIKLVELGSMNFSDLKGLPVDEGSELGIERSEGTGFDGPIAYSEGDLEIIDKADIFAEKLMAELGGAFVKYGPTKNALLTPREQKYLKTDNDELWIEKTPFFNEGPSEVPLKNQIIHFNKFDRFKIEDVVSDASDSLVKPRDVRGFWNTSAMDFMTLGSLDDVADDSVLEANSFIKKFVRIAKEIAPDLDVDGGELRNLIEKMMAAHDKYVRKYETLINSKSKIEKKGRGRVPAIGGGMMFDKGSATKVIKGWKDEFPKETAPELKEFADVDWNNKVDGTAKGVSQYMAIQLYRVLNGKEKPTNALYWPWFGTRSFFERVVIPTMQAEHAKNPFENWRQVSAALQRTFPDTMANISTDGAYPSDSIKKLAEAEIRTALELQFTEEIVYLFKTLKKQAPLFLGRFKEWASQPNTILLTSHMALSKLSVSEKFAKESVSFLKGIYDSKNPQQEVNARVQVLRNGNSQGRKKVIQGIPSTSQQLESGVFTRTQKEKLFLSQYKGMQIERLACDAFIVDEVHNFNRAFQKVPKGTMVPTRTFAKGDDQEDANLARIHVKGRPSRLSKQIEFDTSANYDVRIEVQNFISVALYFQERARLISENQGRKVENTIFLSATPFTDDNFQMLSLFGTLSMKKLMQANIFNAFDFFMLYARERWQKDIDYRNNYSLFPKIIGYKNIYSLSQFIRTFTNFKISDAEIEANRPQKVVIGTNAPVIKGVDAEDAEALSKLVSQIPFSEAQKKMNKDLEDYVTLKSDGELSFTQADVNKALKVYDKLRKKSKDAGSVAQEQIDELKTLVNVVVKKGEDDTYTWDTDNSAQVETLVFDILELDPEAEIALAIKSSLQDAAVEAAEGEASAGQGDKDEDVGEGVDANALAASSAGQSDAQMIASRALTISGKQITNLLTPYFTKINGDDRLNNPYLPDLDGTFSENAKRFVENSPKLLYTSKAITKVLTHAFEEQGQRYLEEGNKLMGQVVFSKNYTFVYHGQKFFIYDLMIQYLIDTNKELLMKIVDNDETKIRSLFASIDARSKGEKAAITAKFLNGDVLVLFGTEIIKEGINLQKNCPIMYILQVGFQPVTYMQLHGRIWRQKNPYKYAFLINVLTQNSVDAFVYSKLDQKIASVKEMLKSEVYDSEATQFDVDVNEIKTALISDPKKLAEMQWDEFQQTESRTKDRLAQELPLLRDVEVSYGPVKEKFEQMVELANEIGQLTYDAEMIVGGNVQREFDYTTELENMVSDDVMKKYMTQFPDEQTRYDFQIGEGKLDKDGNPLYKKRSEIEREEIQKVLGKVQKMGLQEAIKKFKDQKDEFKRVVTPTYPSQPTFTTLNDYRQVFDVLWNLSSIGHYGKTTFELADVERVAKSLDKLGDSEAFLEACKGFTSRSKWSEFKRVLELAIIFNKFPEYLAFKPEAEDSPATARKKTKYGEEKSAEIRDHFRELFPSGMSSSINAFNDLVASQYLEDEDRFAELKDVPKLLEETEKQLNDITAKLANEEATLEIFEKEAAEKIKQRDGVIQPSVDARVQDLDVILKYLVKEPRN